MVKSICCGPSTTVASESDFSMGSDFVWAKRNRLSARRLQHLTFVKRQLQKEIQDLKSDIFCAINFYFYILELKNKKKFQF